MTVRAFVLHPTRFRAGDERDAAEDRLEEAVGLALAINLEIAGAESFPLGKSRPSTLLRSGSVERYADLIEAEEIDLVVLDAALTPVQQRNLERAWRCKVIDRTGLILEIFGERARTKEGKLQVELASLTFQRSRLVRSWTHLERQRGGFGFMGGPGESQLEIDRRLITDRITKIKKDLTQVKRTRSIHRDARKRVPYPVVALVGYTNAGKSTLFNRLTDASVRAEDLLFATLDPTMRRVKLPSGSDIILSDTVGFISDLPTDLVVAFRATLEEVTEADILLHVRDISHTRHEDQRRDVEAILAELGWDDIKSASILEALNKSDAIDEEAHAALQARTMRHENLVLCSALTGDGLDQLLELIDARLQSGYQIVDLVLEHHEGALSAWLHQNGEVLDREDTELGQHLKVRLSPESLGRLQQLHPDSKWANEDTGPKIAVASLKY